MAMSDLSRILSKTIRIISTGIWLLPVGVVAEDMLFVGQRKGGRLVCALPTKGDAIESPQLAYRSIDLAGGSLECERVRTLSYKTPLSR